MTANRDLAREPCPDRIVEDIGGAFGMGCVGGFLWHYGKGWYNYPKGEKMLGGLYSGRMRAPILGGNFAVWGGTFSTFDCTFQYLRNRDDHWNAIASGAFTGGVLALRGGWKSASRQAVIGGVLLAIIEGVMIVFSKRTASTPRADYYESLKYEEKMKAQASKPKSSWLSYFNTSKQDAVQTKETISSEFDTVYGDSSSTKYNQYSSPDITFSSFASEFGPSVASETVKGQSS